MRYIIIGAGAIGGTIGGRLSQHGHDTLLIARGDHGAAIRERGLTVRSPDDTIIVHPPVAARPEEVRLRDDDVLVLATKSHQAEAALLQWVDQPVHAAGDGAEGGPIGTAGELLPILTALNGVASERMALRYFDRVFGVCVLVPAVHLVPGEVIVRIAPGSGAFVVGPYPRQGAADPATDALLEELARDWRDAGFSMKVADDVMRFKHAKLLANLGNGLSALLGGGEGHAPLAGRLRSEARNVFEALGIAYADDEEQHRARGAAALPIRPVPGEPAGLSGSSWQSMTRGSGTVETDFLNGEIAYLAREAGLSAPLNACLQGLTRRAAAAGRRPGDLTLAELEAAFDAAESAAGNRGDDGPGAGHAATGAASHGATREASPLLDRGLRDLGGMIERMRGKWAGGETGDLT